MTIPTVTTGALEEAMNLFDKELRNTPYWAKWQEDKTYRYAIEQHGQLYPVKKVVSLATGTPVTEFSGGDQANAYVEKRGFKVIELPERATHTWIFQANPEIYDTRGAVGQLSELTWLVARYKDEIGPGDRVYLWESGPGGGIVSVAEVLDRPNVRPMPQEEVPFVRKMGKLESENARVHLRVVGVVEPVLTRAEISLRPELANLQILKQPQGTNFAVEKQEAKVLEDLLAERIKSNRSPVDFTAPETLRRLYGEFQKDEGSYAEWWTKLTTFLQMMEQANESDRARLEFQQRIWDENPVSAVGQGFISVDKALEDEEFRKWIAAKSLEPLPEEPDEASARLAEFADAVVERIRPYCRQIPYLKIFRVLTAFFPGHFTTIADRGKLKEVHIAMLKGTGGPWSPQFESSASHAVKRHANILTRLTEVLGPLPADLAGLARRISFPWYLYEILHKQGASGGNSSVATDSLTAVAEELLIDRDYLAGVIRLLEKKRQLIFYGPPGTGKTFIARRVARFLGGSDERIETVQFHASYAYEDFVEGYRPKLLSNGQPGFDLVDGPLKRIANKARNNPDETHILLIDEVNRGNVAKVFGELFYLLEYRDEQIALLYSRNRFKLCENLFVIATMNTADRSIALLDAALRRRFYFIPFFPDEPPIQGLLRRWLQKNMENLLWVADVVDVANEKLKDRNAAIGPSHFMVPHLSEEWVRLIWKHSIIPNLAEQFFGQEDRLSEFELESLRQSIANV
jgi:MoxR-like ATPase